MMAWTRKEILDHLDELASYYKRSHGYAQKRAGQMILDLVKAHPHEGQHISKTLLAKIRKDERKLDYKAWDKRVSELLENAPPVREDKGRISSREAWEWWNKGMKPETAARRIVLGKYTAPEVNLERVDRTVARARYYARTLGLTPRQATLRAIKENLPLNKLTPAERRAVYQAMSVQAMRF